MRIGSIGYATYQGLGILLKDFYDNGIITDVLTVQHWKHSNHSWYRGPSTTLNRFSREPQLSFAESMDIMFFFETPFDLEVIPFCKRVGTKTILMPMYECTPNDPRINSVDEIINPSLLDQKYYPSGAFIPVPIPRWVEWKERKQARVFVHNAGHLGLNGRNGTLELLQAMEYVRSPIRLIVRSQNLLQLPPITRKRVAEDYRVELRVGTVPKEDLYDEGDVFIFPEKYNGLSLPLQEAKASGMLVMCCDRFPMNTWNNSEHLIPVAEYRNVSANMSREVEYAIPIPRDIASTIDRWYEKDIRSISHEGNVFRRNYSWDNLGQLYKDRITSCLEEQPV